MKKLGIAVISLLILASTLLVSQPAHAESEQSEATFKLCSDEEADLLRLYFALFDRKPDQKGGDYWVHAFRQNASLDDLAYWMSKSPEFSIKYKKVTTKDELIDKFYKNIFKRKPDAEGKAYWMNQLDQGLSPHLVARWMAKSPELAKRHPYAVAPSCPELEKAKGVDHKTQEKEDHKKEETKKTTVYYKNCTEVWKYLGRPITKTDKGYSHDLDRDKDGIGCESEPS